MHTLDTALTADLDRPWYREPMLWLVTGIPMLTVVAGLATVVIAHRTSDTIVSDEFRKDGLAINLDPTRDRAAAALGATATVRFAGGILGVRLSSHAATAPTRLLVLFSHATRADLDQLVTLDRLPDGSYATPLRPMAGGHWYLEVSPPDRAWRLTGEFNGTLGELALAPRPVR